MQRWQDLAVKYTRRNVLLDFKNGDYLPHSPAPDRVAAQRCPPATDSSWRSPPPPSCSPSPGPRPGVGGSGREARPFSCVLLRPEVSAWRRSSWPQGWSSSPRYPRLTAPPHLSP